MHLLIDRIGDKNPRYYTTFTKSMLANCGKPVRNICQNP